MIYLRSLDCPLSETIYLAAAKLGHLEILKWAEFHVCPWDNFDLFSAAVPVQGFKILKFTRANGLTVISVGFLNRVQDCAADRGDLKTILWALDQMKRLYNEPQMRIKNILIAAAKCKFLSG